MRVALTRQAARDVEEAYDFYAGIDLELSTRFTEDVDATIERMVMFPRGAPMVEGFDGLRRVRVRRFPYGNFYQQTPGGDLLVVRVLHSRRHLPGALES